MSKTHLLLICAAPCQPCLSCKRPRMTSPGASSLRFGMPSSPFLLGSDGGRFPCAGDECPSPALGGAFGARRAAAVMLLPGALHRGMRGAGYGMGLVQAGEERVLLATGERRTAAVTFRLPHANAPQPLWSPPAGRSSSRAGLSPPPCRPDERSPAGRLARHLPAVTLTSFLSFRRILQCELSTKTAGKGKDGRSWSRGGLLNEKNIFFKT